jgi:hypothetical protein
MCGVESSGIGTRHGAAGIRKYGTTHDDGDAKLLPEP